MFQSVLRETWTWEYKVLSAFDVQQFPSRYGRKRLTSTNLRPLYIHDSEQLELSENKKACLQRRTRLTDWSIRESHGKL